MHQIVYIDIDEEITSIVERLRKSKASDIFFAVPKRALILQSIVSLKLLKRESDKLEKKIMFVSQDEQERRVIEKAGILTRVSIDGLETSDEIKENVSPRMVNNDSIEKKEAIIKKTFPKNEENLGSNGFYDNTTEKAKGIEPVARPLTLDGFRGTVRQTGNISSATPAKTGQLPMIQPENNGLSEKQVSSNLSKPGLKGKQPGKVDSERIGQSRGDLLLDFFGKKNQNIPSQVHGSMERNDSSRAKKVSSRVPRSIHKTLTFFVAFCLLLIIGILGYLFLPSAKVKVLLKSRVIEKELEIKADAGLGMTDQAALAVPARVIEKESVFTFTYPPTGISRNGKSASSQKAKGTVVIYNEYSSAPQALVVNTRLLSEDKKLFRLVRGVTVPGMKEINGQSQPGAVEVEVVADQAGEEYNIGPARFSIPGFEGSPKYDKFYAKSTKSMAGGGSGSSSDMPAQIIQGDLAGAKIKSESAAKAKIREELKKEMNQGEILPDGVAEESIIESSAMAKIGDTASQFGYSVKIRGRIIVFKEADAKSIFEQQIRGSLPENSSDGEVKLEYGIGSANWTERIVYVKVHGKVTYEANLDPNSFKADLAGKKDSEVKEVIKKYPQIKEVEFDFSPEFFPRKFSNYPKRIEVTVQ